MSAILELTDGTNTVSLLGGPFHLASWRPALPQYKNSGVFVDSPLSDGRRIVYKKFAHITERFDLKQRAGSHDLSAEYMSQLFDLMEKASDHWTTSGVIDAVYLKAKSTNESNPRYAIVTAASMPDQENPFGSPFLQSDCAALQDNLVLIVEHGLWQSAPPGEVTDLELTYDTVQDNLIHNGSFETRSAQIIGVDTPPEWTSYNSPTDVAVTSAQAYAGRESVYIEGTSGAYKGIYQEISGLTNGVDYTITARALVATGGGSLIAYDGGGYTNPVIDSTSTRDQELLLNTSFETNLNNWGGTLATVTKDSGQSYQGSSSMKVVFVEGSYKTTPYYRHDLVALSPGVSQVQCEHAGLVTQDAATAYGYIGFFDESQNPIDLNGDPIPTHHSTARGWVSYWRIRYIAGSKWRYFRSSTNVPSNAAYATVGIWIDSTLPYSTHTMYTDAWSLIETIAAQNPPAGWDTLSVTKTAPAGGAIRVAVATSTSLGGEVYFDDVQLERDFEAYGQTSEPVFVANYMAEDNISHIFRYDGSATSWSDNLLDEDLPYVLFPDTAAASNNQDMIYFGAAREGSISSVEGHSPFTSLAFDLASVAEGVSLDITWQYLASGSTWTNLEPRDETDGFTKLGRNVVSWYMRDDWMEAGTVNSVSGWWVRAIISTYPTADWTSPIQQNYHPHVVTLPYFEVDSSELGGDLKALAKYEIQNEGGPFAPEDYFYVSADADDAFFDDDATSMDPDPAGTGDPTETIDVNTGIGVRFQNVTIPQGAVITRARLFATSNGGAVGTDCGVTIEGHDSDNSGAWASYADYSGRNRTTASINWALGYNAWNNYSGYWHESPSIISIIQEIVDRTSWASGNALSLFLDDYSMSGSDARSFKMYESNSLAWGLDIEWVEKKTYVTTLIMGSRRVDRGSNFRGYLNFISRQPESISMELGENSALDTAPFTANAGNVSARNEVVRVGNLDQESGDFRDRVTIRIHSPLAAEYSGRFRAFARVSHQAVQQNYNTYLRLKVTSGSGGIDYTSPVFISELQAPELVDFGLVSIPRVDAIDTIALAVQAKRNDSNIFYLLDLILIPADEWMAELSSMSNKAAGILSGDTYLELNSAYIKEPDGDFSARLRRVTDGAMAGNYIVSGGGAVLDNRATQRVWCLTVTDIGINQGTIQNASLSHGVISVQASALLRYMGMRGAS